MMGPDIILNARNEDSLIEAWQVHLKKARKKHALSARRAAIYDRYVSYPAAAIQAIVAASVFGTLLDSNNKYLLSFAIVLTLLSSALVALGTKGDFGVRAAKHRSAERRLKSVLQDLEEERLNLSKTLGNQPNDETQKVMSRVDKLKQRWTEIESEAPDYFSDIDDDVENNFNPEEKCDLVKKCNNKDDRPSLSGSV